MVICEAIKNEVNKYISKYGSTVDIEMMKYVMTACKAIEDDIIFDDEDAFVCLVSEDTGNLVLSFASPEINFISSHKGFPDLIEKAFMVTIGVDCDTAVLAIVYSDIFQ